MILAIINFCASERNSFANVRDIDGKLFHINLAKLHETIRVNKSFKAFFLWYRHIPFSLALEEKYFRT